MNLRHKDTPGKEWHWKKMKIGIQLLKLKVKTNKDKVKSIDEEIILEINKITQDPNDHQTIERGL